MIGYVNNIEELTLANENFRQVLYTGKHCQLVLMSLKPSEDIGMEVHESVDQFFRIEKGEGKVIIDGVENIIKEGSAIIIPAGANHNVINSSTTEALKLYTIYSPANHQKDIVHATKADAEADEGVEHFDGVTTE
ncbi:MAG: cupin domain-containing protein [Candidatus Vogelbacteria bacterium]|nr:cupin domain-containing protein [Candidatus Vogelbacteria bacterium]